MFRRLARARFTRLLRFSRDSRSRIAPLRTVLRPGVQFPVSRFSSVRVRQVRAERVRRYVRANVVRCTRHAPDLVVRVLWELAQACRLPERLRVQAAVRAAQRADRASATFLVA